MPLLYGGSGSGMYGGAGAFAFLTGGSIAGVTGVSVKLAQWGVPVGMAPTGSMANNGAVTLGTALPATFSNGIWLYYPAGAVAAGVPASATYLWTVMSSTTLGTVFNSTFDGLSVPVAGTATAYSTTGPGAFAGVTSITTAVTITIPANTLGTSGAIVGDWNVSQSSNASNRVYSILYSGTGGTDYGVTLTTSGGGAGHTAIRNQSTGVQNGGSFVILSANATGSTTILGAADTTASTTLVFRLTNAAATNTQILNGGNFTTLQ